MSQQIFGQTQESATKPVMNVPEAWMLYDTILIGGYYATVKPNFGYYQAYATFGAVSEHSFFNVRNRAHGLPYNNQDTRDQLPYVMHIYGIGVAWYSPSTSAYLTVNPPLGEETLVNKFWQLEVPKHVSVTFKTNQDERLLTTALMAPPGYGPVGGGVGVGEYSAGGVPSIHHTSFSMGESTLVNMWGFPKPLQIPRTANISVTLRLNAYVQAMLAQFTGPLGQPIKALANDGTNFNAPGCAAIQVFLRGKREVQQRGQYHA